MNHTLRTLQFKRVDISNTHLLENFVKRAGKSLDTFRYFAKRPYTIVQQHACTWVILEDGQAEAYGHLDKEGDTVWLGIAVTDHARGKGYGRAMMQRLMDSALALGLQRVRLSVDHVNENAIRLYERFGFRLTEKKETFGFYEWQAPALKKAVMSSLAFMGQAAEEMIALCQENDFALEFSSGMPYRADMEQVFLDAPLERFAHNYFPAPEIPFVLNLGSADEQIRRTSILHCVNGIRLSHAVGAPFFSAHAGFCIDPKPAELGRQLSRVEGFDREMHWNLFLESVRELLMLTSDLPTGFLVENNVLAKMNVYADGSNPLLCAEPGEMLALLREIPDPRLGILLDTAHLKVSALTLGFDATEAAKIVLPFTRCIHHSDNDGLQDNNRPFGTDYWFLPLAASSRAVQVLEVRKQTPEALRQMESLIFKA